MGPLKQGVGGGGEPFFSLGICLIKHAVSAPHSPNITTVHPALVPVLNIKKYH